MNEPAPPPSATPPPRSLTTAKRALLASALVAIIASATFSFWETALETDVIPRSALHSIRAAFTWDPTERRLARLVASENRGVEMIEAWVNSSGAFRDHLLKNNLRDTDFETEVQIALRQIRDDYEAFLADFPSHSAGRIAYGDYLQRIDDSDGATREWNHAMDLAPNAEAWDRRARIAYYEDDYGKALAAFEKAVELEGDNWDYHYQLASLVFSNQKAAAAHYHEAREESAMRAISHFRKAEQLNPENYSLVNELGFAYASLNPPLVEESIAAWERSARLAPGELARESVYLNIAGALITAKRYADARKQIDRSRRDELRSERRYLMRRISSAQGVVQ